MPYRDWQKNVQLVIAISDNLIFLHPPSTTIFYDFATALARNFIYTIVSKENLYQSKIMVYPPLHTLKDISGSPARFSFHSYPR